MRGHLFPRFGAMARFARDGSVTLVDARAGWSSNASGEVAQELRALFECGEPSPRLSQLAEPLPALANAIHWAQSPSIPLTRSNAISLGGYDTLFIELVGQCNERCLHCYASSSPDIRAKLEKDEVFAALSDASELGFARVQFTGGDPLLCSFLPEAALRAKELGIGAREIYTNGIALTPRLLEALLPAEPSFAFSFYSHRPEVHDRITQTPGSHKRTLAAIERAIAAGCGVRTAMVVLKENRDDVEETIALLKAHGAQRTAVSSSFEVGRGQLHAAPPPDSATTSSHVGAHSGSTVGRGRGKACITYDGDVVPCIFARNRVLGNVRERSLGAILRDPSRRRPVASLSDVLVQSARELSCTSCRLTAAALTPGSGRD